MAVVDYGDGVFAFEYAAFVPSVNSEAVYSKCNEATRYVEGPVDKVLVVTNGHYDFSYEQLAGKIFGVEAELMTNLKQLIKRGAEIRDGISNGSVKNALLIPVISQAVGVEDAYGNMLPIINANTTIPYRSNKHISLNASVPVFNIKLWQGNHLKAINNTLLADINLENDIIQSNTNRVLDITIDINANMLCRYIIKDTLTGRIAQKTIGD